MLPIAIVSGARRALAEAWWWLRQVTGDAGYENYLRSAELRDSATGEPPPLSAKEYYLDQLRRRYSRLNRCC